MTARCFIAVCFFLNIVLAGKLFAQDIPHFLEKLTTEEGLSSNKINDIVQDDAGFLWIATSDGLDRFDGTEVTQYFHKATVNSLPHNHVNGIDNYTVCGDYDNCHYAAAIVDESEPDVIIMDIDLPGVNGVDGLRVIKERRPQTYIIMHTVFEDEEHLFQCLCLGANGYILKNMSFMSLVEAIDNVLHGEAPLSPSIAKKVLQSFQTSSQVRLQYKLSEREAEILKYLVKGFSYKMIASSCFISVDTVRGHIRNIYNKLHVNFGREAVEIALRDKIV